MDAIVIDYQDPDKQDLYNEITSAEQASVHQEFADRYLNLSPRFESSEAVRDYCRDVLDGVVVGSDAVFRIGARYGLRRALKALSGRSRKSLTTVGRESLPPYWLPWPLERAGHQIPKISLAASASGTRFYLIDVRLYRPILESIRDLDHITVRDRWTSLMIRFLSLGSRTAHHCPDPVFALNKHFGELPATQFPEGIEDTILLSGRYPEAWLEELAREASALGYRLGNLPNPDKPFRLTHTDVRIDLPLSPLDWYQLLAKARGYVGIRFHAMVSCMANGTPFLTTDPAPRFDLLHHRWASRYRDLCSRANVMDRYFVARHVSEMRPREVLERLFNQRSLQAASDYAARAGEQFESEIDRIIRLVEAARG